MSPQAGLECPSSQTLGWTLTQEASAAGQGTGHQMVLILGQAHPLLPCLSMGPSSQKAAPYNRQPPSSQKKPAERLGEATFSAETLYTVAQFGLRQELPTLLLYCLEQWGQQTGGVAMVPVSWVCVLSMGSGSPGPAGRSFRMLGGSSAPGWFFRMWAFRLLALL